MARVKRILQVLLFLITVSVCGSSHAEDWTQEDLHAQIAYLEKTVPEIDGKAREILKDLGERTRQQLIEQHKEFQEEIKVWDEDLELTTSESFDIESRREELKENVRLWTNAPGGWSLDELQKGIADALVIARSDGLPVDRLTELYELSRKIIRTADFVPQNSGNLAKIDALNLTTSDRPSNKLYNVFMTLWGLGRTVVASEARAREDHLRYRKGLYKRAVIAYIRALISGNEEPGLCKRTIARSERIGNGSMIPLLDCPDPVVEKLKAYARAIQKIQSADTEMFKAEVQILIAEQQFVSDVMSAVPLIGEALDIYGVLFGTDIAGQCLTSEEQAISVVFLSLPYVGQGAPWVIEQIEKRSPRAAEVFASMRLIFEILSEESGSAYLFASREIHEDVKKKLANLFSVPLQKLDDAMSFFKGVQPKLDAEAQGRMTTFRTVRNAVESRHWRDQLPEKALKEARKRSAKLMKENLGNYQMARSARKKASHIVDYHIPVLEKVAQERDEIIVLRYVNEAATELIAGGAGTKHMGIKGKSANRGPIKALLPVNQNLNKQGSRLEDLRIAQKKRTLDPDELIELTALRKGIDSGEKSMKKCLLDPQCAAAIDLPIKHPTREGDTLLMVARDKTKERHVYFIQEADGTKIHYETGEPIHIDVDPDYPIESVQVLADPDTGVPLTADYDFLGLGVKGAHGVPRFDPETGYVTNQMNETLKAVNDGIAETQRARGLTPQKVSHHGAERWFPFSPGALDVDPFVTVFDPQAGIMRIPRCDYDCMRAWCKNSGQCNPAVICPPRVFDNCIPPDYDRLLKDYYHDRRLADYDMSPNSVWSWGHYNPGGGWTFMSYAESFRQKQVKAKLASDSGSILTPPGATFANFGKERIKLPDSKAAFQWVKAAAHNRSISNVTQLAVKKGIPDCTERAP